MARRNLEDRNVQKILKSGGCYCISLPIEMIRKLGWIKK